MKSFREFLNKKTSSPEELAKKHNLSVERINKALISGIEIEKEDTSHIDVAREIALDHIGEDPEYYEKLKKVENG